MNNKNKIGRYLLGLNPICGDNKVWFPKIDEEDLVRLRGNDNPIVIAHDWFSHGSYEYGSFTILDDNVIPLQNHPDTRIVNSEGKFVFEQGTQDHKGLIAIETPTSVMSSVFVAEHRFDQEEMKESVSLWFEPETSEEFKNKVVSMLQTDNTSFDIHEDWISVFAEEYEQITTQLNVLLT